MRQDNFLSSLSIESNSNVAEAWETFTERGDIESSSVRKTISQSWMKSRELGICPETERSQTVISREEIEEKIKTEDLGRAGVSALNKVSDILYGSQHVVVMADAQGRILYSIGHEQIQQKLERINFVPGGAWSEKSAGANGIGTALALGRPEVVIGHEHYCKGWHPWVCYGAPIHDFSGKTVIGSIDITGPVEQINKETMALTVSIAQSVQYGIYVIQTRRRDVLRELGKGIVSRWPSEGVVILDENGFIVEYNSKAIKYLALQPSCFMTKTLTQLVPGLDKAVQNSMKNRLNIETNLHTEVESSLPLPLKIRLQPIVKEGRNIGLALVMSDLSASTQGVTQQVSKSKYSFKHLLGSSEKLNDVLRLARIAANDPLHSNVLLVGETGTGKELLAHSIHSESNRFNEPFIAVNCAAIPDDLIESELFGYVSGAFTGARRTGLKGKFESAHNGTLFLDEINSMSPELQSKFLRVLDCMEITPIGSSEIIPVNVRVLAAANEKLFAALKDGTFRIDLFYRLSVLEIQVPTLLERSNDILELANEFLQSKCQAAGRKTLSIDPDVADLLLNYSWPGNIRELHNLCVRWTLTVVGEVVTCRDLPERLHQIETENQLPVGKDLRYVSDELIKQTLNKNNQNITQAAKTLGIDRTTIYRRRRRW